MPWHDRALFHFITQAADRRRYLSAWQWTLRPGGNLIIASFAIGGPERCSGLEIVQYGANTLQVELGSEFELQAVTPKTPTRQVQEFNYFRYRRS